MTSDLLAVPAGRPDPVRALARVRGQLGVEHARSRRRTSSWLGDTRLLLDLGLACRRLALAAVALIVALLVAALTLTPAGSFAQNLLTIFQPKQFVAVPVTLEDLRSLPNLQQFGTVSVPASTNARTVADAAAAARVAGLAVRVPSALPAGVPRAVNYSVALPSTASFTFSAAKARAAAAKTKQPLPPMPASLDGSTLRVTVGPIVIATYGGDLHGSGIPTLLIAQAPAPRVTSTRATTSTILHYLLAQPGISPRLAASIRAIGDPSTTLPIPIPIDLASAQRVPVQGVQGLAIGDATGIGSAVVWQKGGMVYGVAGTLPESQILAIAASLH